MKNYILNSLRVIFVLVVSLVIGSPAFSEPSIGGAAPQFNLKDQDGKSVSLGDFKGKILVMHWTNANCPFIKRHYRQKTFSSLADKYKDQSVAVVAIDSTKSASLDSIKSAHAENVLNYPILLDADGSLGKAYGAKTTPHVFIIDKSGTLVYRGAVDDDGYGEKGAASENYVAKALDELLAGRTITNAENKSYGCSVKYL